MKKIIVLTMLVLLAIGMPVVAVDFGGDFSLDASSNFKEGFDENFDLSLDVSQDVDDYNTVSFELELDHGDVDLEDFAEWMAWDMGGQVGDEPDVATFFAVHVDNPKLTTDIGAALGLVDFGVGAVVNSGIFESASQEFVDITGYGIENVAYVEAALEGGAELVLTFVDMVNVQMASDFYGDAKNWIVGSYGTFGPVSAEVYYACEGDALADGQLIVDAAFSQELGILALDAGAGFWYDLGIDEADDGQWAYGVGVAASADVGVTVGGGVGVMGTSVEDHILEAVAIDLGLAPLEDLGIDVGFYLNMFKDAEPMMDHVDFSVWKNFGAAEYRVGYLYSGKDADAGSADALNAPITGGDINGGGFYLAVDIDY